MIPPDLPLLALGLATGFLSGLMGVGGGFMVVPALELVGWPAADAIGTSLAYVTAVGVAGALGHAKAGNVAPRVVAAAALPAMLAAQAGAYLTALAPGRLLDGAFAVLLAYAAAELGWAPKTAGDQAPPSLPAIGALGGMVGGLSGLLGVGGGVLLVPGQVRWLRLPLLQAIGNSLAIVVLTGASGVVGHLLRGHVRLPGAGWLVVGGLAGVQLGLRALRRVPATRLRLGFTAFLGLLAIYMAVRGLRI